MKKMLSRLFARVLLAVVLAAAWIPATATSYIRDVMLVGGAGKAQVVLQMVTYQVHGWEYSRKPSR